MPTKNLTESYKKTWPFACRVHAHRIFSSLFLFVVIFFIFSLDAKAAESTLGIKGANLSLFWLIPFVGILLSIALAPLFSPTFWHHHFGKVAAFWALAFIVPFSILHGGSSALYEVTHTVLLEYIPFIVLIATLFTISGGIYIGGVFRGTPLTNTSLLLAGWFLASFIGTTGASMVMIRPVLRANASRVYNKHVIIFFIFLVSNIGGALTPLGDPPLFLGFLKGVDFFWPLKFLFGPTVIVTLMLLIAFYLLDSYIYRRDGVDERQYKPAEPIKLHGYLNIALLIALAGTVIISGVDLKLGGFSILGVEVSFLGLLRDGVLISLLLASLVFTPSRYRESNGFNWLPCIEVAKLFLAIFITIIPAIAMLRAGEQGAMAPLIRLLSGPDGSPDNFMYFWLCGGLSGVLDNAPTYLIFFNAAGGNAENLMGPLAGTLIAISIGAVFMGANTYIGNAPNFLVKTVAEQAGVKMPSFFGYVCWSFIFLLPCFIIVSLIYFS